MNSTYYVELDCLVQEAGNELLANQVDFLKSTEMLAWGLAFLAIILALAAVLVHGAFWASMAFLIIDVPVTALTFLLRRALPGKARIMVQKKKVGQLYRTMA